MGVLARATLYIKRNKRRCLLLLLILTIISSTLMICFAVWKSSQDGIDELRKTYGSNFNMEINNNFEDSSLWESYTDPITGAEAYNYKGSRLNDDVIEKVMSVQGIKTVCKMCIRDRAYAGENIVSSPHPDCLKRNWTVWYPVHLASNPHIRFGIIDC